MNLKRKSAILRANNLPAFKSTYVGKKGKSEIFYSGFIFILIWQDFLAWLPGSYQPGLPTFINTWTFSWSIYKWQAEIVVNFTVQSWTGTQFITTHNCCNLSSKNIFSCLLRIQLTLKCEFLYGPCLELIDRLEMMKIRQFTVLPQCY